MLTAQQSRLWPKRTVNRAEYLYSAALSVNTLNCRDECGMRARILAPARREQGYSVGRYYCHTPKIR
jgi:hypothetical protein